jgi:hypothetical protein
MPEQLCIIWARWSRYPYRCRRHLSSLRIGELKAKCLEVVYLQLGTPTIRLKGPEVLQPTIPLTRCTTGMQIASRANCQTAACLVDGVLPVLPKRVKRSTMIASCCYPVIIPITIQRHDLHFSRIKTIRWQFSEIRPRHLYHPLYDEYDAGLITIRLVCTQQHDGSGHLLSVCRLSYLITPDAIACHEHSKR